MSSSKSRPYHMRKRAEHVGETRRRIIEAAVRLHGTVGPAQTTVTAIAEAAGVTRLTFYRHFPTESDLFDACGAHWLSQQITPDSSAWGRIPDPEQALRAGLSDIYRFYRAGRDMLTLVYRDLHALPEVRRQALAARSELWTGALLEPFRATGVKRIRLRAVIAHAVEFETWQSLCTTNGLEDRSAVQLMTALAAITLSAEAEPDDEADVDTVRSAGRSGGVRLSSP